MRRRAAIPAVSMLGVFLLAVAALASGGAAAADEGKPVTIIVGGSAGGCYDAYGRLLARHIGRHLPGHPSVIVKNLPGAGSLQFANYLYVQAPKDGSEFGIMEYAAPFT